MPSSLRKKTQLHLVVALMLGVVTAFLVSTWLSQQEARIRKVLVSVVVARQPIQPHTRLSAEMVQVLRYPKDLLPDQAVQSSEKILGQYTRTQISPGQIMMPSLVGKPEEIAALSFQLKPGRRAMTIRIDDQSGVAFQLREGDRVDIVGSFDSPTGEAISRIVLQNVRILKLTGVEAFSEQRTRGGATATLDLSPEDAELVALLEAQAAIRLALRPFTDEEEVPATGATIEKAMYAAGGGTPSLPPQETTEPPVQEQKEPENKPKIAYVRGAEVVPVDVQQ